VIALLRSGWRENLVGAVALLALTPGSRPIPALWERIEQWSWAVPQLTAVASIVDHTFAARATELLNRFEESALGDQIADNRTAAAKTAASLLALVEHTPGTSLRSLLAADYDDAGDIATSWRAAILQAFEDARVPIAGAASGFGRMPRAGSRPAILGGAMAAVPDCSVLLASSLPDIAHSMVQEAEPDVRVVESTLKAAAKNALSERASEVGIEVGASERRIHPKEWPRVGAVDVVLSMEARSSDAPALAFVELKWGLKDALWNCVWDIAKCALVQRLGLADQALLLVGFSDAHEWSHNHYGLLMTDRVWDTRAYMTDYHDDWKYWAKPPDTGKEHRTGPYKLPARLSTTLSARHRFTLDQIPWSLGVLAVEAASDDWIDIDEHGSPQ